MHKGPNAYHSVRAKHHPNRGQGHSTTKALLPQMKGANRMPTRTKEDLQGVFCTVCLIAVLIFTNYVIKAL